MARVQQRKAHPATVMDVRAPDLVPAAPTLWQRIVRARYYYLLIAPCFVLLLVFAYYPSFRALYGSLFTFDYGLAEKFVGLKNFVDLLGDTTFIESVWHVLALTLFGVVTGVSVPVAVAEWIFHLRSQRAQYVYRVLMIWPAIVPEVVGLLIWQFIYDPDAGLLNTILRAVGLTAWSQNLWLADPNLALYALMGASFPFVGGAAVLIYLAGLQGISSEVLDAASIDGAAGLRRFFAIDLPLIKGQIRLNMILALITGIQSFIGSLLLTNGGPMNATMVPTLYMYQQGFTYGRIGYASAIGVVIFLAVLFLTVLNLTVLRDRA
ncbi:MAG: sugar ABC transporter permease [Chloroflexota bacterium]